MHCGTKTSPLCIQHCIWLTSLSFQINRPSLKIWSWKSKVKVMGEVEVPSHNMSLTSWTSYRLTSLWFHVKWPSHSSDTAFSLTLEIQGQGHSSRSQSRDNTLSTLIPFVPCQSPVTFLGYSYFKIWHWKSKVKVISEVKVESHNVGPTFSRLTSISFHVNRASHSWVATFSKFALANQGPRSCFRSHFEVTMWV